LWALDFTLFTGPLSPVSYLPPLPFFSPSLHLLYLSFPLEVAPLKIQLWVWWSGVSSSSRVWGRAPVEIEFSAF